MVKKIIQHLRSIQSLFEREYQTGELDEYEPMELAFTIKGAVNLLEWQSLATAPRDGTFVELRGDSGYNKYPYRVMIARYEKERETDWDGIRRQTLNSFCWRTVQGDHCTDDGEMPTHWRPAS